MKYLLKNIFFKSANLFAGHPVGKASILMYHSIGYNRAFFTVTPENLEEQLLYLRSNNFNVISLSELVNKIKTGADLSHCVSITLDDGYHDNLAHAFPIFEKYNMPRTYFIATDPIGRYMNTSDGVSLSIMTEDELKKVSKSSLVEIMPHTASHKLLTTYNDDSWKDDIEKSRRFLIERFGSRADIFAYPQGKFSDKHANYLKNSGYIAAVTVKEGLVKSRDDTYRLDRNSIDSTTTIDQFAGKLSETIEWYSKIKRYIRS
ncbi:polysaccharide deacetylase family protein [Patescibacteria group bacterium]|nr:polysaccharide deacetylase family protein [Patescibacteria group bacterium]MDE1946802.1 polysaccharide deacetylase family protein [Patescibacteria group bacterium]MDE2011140.1 polysaccharide deacetylase family protein [Patescibacteria group bacterium]MDE2233049.1 polysaccharide deacetylase family protein [Patescibacteria group bacterium]